MLKIARKALRSETGAVLVLELLLLVAVLGLAGIAVYQGYKARHTANQPVKPTPRSAAQSSVPSDLTANWKTYESNSDGISFRYPADWRVLSDIQPRPGDWYQQFDIGPATGDTKFKLTFRALDNPSTGFDKSSCRYVRAITDITIPDFKPARLVAFGKNGKVSHLAVTEIPERIIGQEAGCSGVFASKVGRNKFVDVSGAYVIANHEVASFGLDEFLQKPEVRTAQQILKTLSYTSANALESPKILEAAAAFCRLHGMGQCTGFVELRRGDNAIVRTPDRRVVVSRSSGSWTGIIASQLTIDMCSFGTDAPAVVELCRR